MKIIDGITMLTQVASALPLEKWLVRDSKKKALDDIEKRVGAMPATQAAILNPSIQSVEQMPEVNSSIHEFEDLGSHYPYPLAGVSDRETLSYQLDQLIDDFQHLEEHLSRKGRLLGKPCDCISKAARDTRRHALETIPIASRQGKDGVVFSAIASWAEGLIQIGTPEAVRSGKYNDQYLKEAGVASRYRKQIQILQTVWMQEKKG